MSKRTLTTLLSAIALSATAALSVPTATLMAAPPSEAGKSSSAKAVSNNFYIVRLAESPVTAYKGGIKGYAGDEAGQGPEDRSDVVEGRQLHELPRGSSRRGIWRAAGGGKKVYSYGYVFNGFAAELTEAQADKIRSMKGVLSVEKDDAGRVDTSSTPSFLELDAPGGLWDQLGGASSAGENIIIGVIDSGVWPESLSFSDRTGTNGNASKDGKLAYQQIPGWHGKCAPGEAFNASLCNQKLIGAQHFNAGLGWRRRHQRRSVPGSSPRSATTTVTAHTPRRPPAATQSARHRRPAQALRHASAASRRAHASRCTRRCGQRSDTATASGHGSTSSRRSITAVADGVDVINYSISGSTTNFARPGRDRLPVRCGRRCVRRGLGRATAVRRTSRLRTRARGSPRWQRARITAAARAR